MYQVVRFNGSVMALASNQYVHNWIKMWIRLPPDPPFLDRSCLISNRWRKKVENDVDKRLRF